MLDWFERKKFLFSFLGLMPHQFVCGGGSNFVPIRVCAL